MVSIDEFRKYLEINKHALDDEVIKHPSLFFTVSEEYVNAAAKRDAAKEDLAAVDAEIDEEVRRGAKQKLTEGAIKAAVILDEEHLNAFNRYCEAKRNADLWGALKDAFQQRGYMLRDLCSLWCANFYEESSIKGTSQTDSAVYQGYRAKQAAHRNG